MAQDPLTRAPQSPSASAQSGPSSGLSSLLRYRQGMDAAQLSLVEVRPRKERVYWYTFEPSDEFVKPWWRRESSIRESEHWISVQRAGIEVARCKFTLDERPTSNPVLGVMPHGQLDILALEVAVSSQRCGVGRGVLCALRAMYPLPRLTALNDNEGSRGFWDSVGWSRHESPHEWLRSERVTYSKS